MKALISEDQLTRRATAFYLYLKGYHFSVIAAALGVTDRTVRNWEKEENWKEDAAHVKAVLKGLVVWESFSAIRRLSNDLLDQEKKVDEVDNDRQDNKTRLTTNLLSQSKKLE